MKRILVALVVCAVTLWTLAVSPGCASRSEDAVPDSLTRNVGNYGPPPAGIQKVRVGVPPFKIIGEGTGGKLNKLAADQLTSLVGLSRRFILIERAQLGQLLDEQDKEGIVREDEMAKRAQVRGVHYLIYGTVSNFRVKADSTSTGVGVARIPIIGVGGFDYKKKDSRIVAECGVDLRMVEPSSGEVVSQHFGEFKRIDTIEAYGVDILGGSAQSDAQLEISEDDQGKILRLALDEAFRKMLLNQIDPWLVERTQAAQAAAAAAAAAAAPPPAPETPAATTPGTPGAEKATPKFCAGCGAKLTPGAKFCGKCGKAVGG